MNEILVLSKIAAIKEYCNETDSGLSTLVVARLALNALNT